MAAFGERDGLTYEISEPGEHRLNIEAYADNFRYDMVKIIPRARSSAG